MDIAELVEIALANSDERRVEVAALEPTGVSMEAVSALSQIVAELVDNAISFSEPGDLVRVTGLHEQDGYLISVSDRGIGLPEHLMSELNRLLEQPGSAPDSESGLGIALVARLAARHDVRVRLVPGAPGTTARITIPGRLLEELQEKPEEERRRPASHRLPGRSPQPDEIFAKADELEETLDLTRFERGHRSRSGVIAMSEEARREAEAFLERVFSPLVERPGITERPAPRAPSEGNGTDHPREPAAAAQPAPESEEGGTVTALRVRVPGESFSPVEDDASTMAAEAAIDIRSALSRYAEGRRSAQDTDSRG